MAALADIDLSDSAWQALRDLFGAYLYQGYGDEDDEDDWRAAVRMYRSSDPPSLTSAAVERIEFLLHHLESDHDIHLAVDRLGLDGYYPPADGWTYRDWLTKVRSILRDE